MEIEKIDLSTNSSIQFLLGLGRHEIESTEFDKYFQVTELMFPYNTSTGGKYIRMTEELRDQLAHEKEQACARERELARKT